MSARELITVKSVVGEIEIQPTSARTSERSDSERINEGMFEWVRRDVSKAEELDPHLAVEVEVAGLRIASTHREWVTDDSIADPYVIAAAKLIGCTVVSSEIRSHTPDQLASHMQFDRIYPRKTKIPSVCDINGVDHLSLVEFFETEGWNY